MMVRDDKSCVVVFVKIFMSIQFFYLMFNLVQQYLTIKLCIFLNVLFRDNFRLSMFECADFGSLIDYVPYHVGVELCYHILFNIHNPNDVYPNYFC